MKTKALWLWFGLLLTISVGAATPALRFSTFVAGDGADIPIAIATDASGFIYVAGYTSSTDLPALTILDGGGNCFVQKLSPNGAAVIFTTVIGNCMPRAIAVNSAGEVFIAGHTFNPEDATLIKLNVAGDQIVFRKTLAGSAPDVALSVVVDPTSGKIWIAGLTYSSDFETQGQPYQPTRASDFDGFLSRISADGSLECSTFLGGPEGGSLISGLALDSQGRPVVCGWTASPQFPSVNPARPFSDVVDGFVARFDGTGRTLLSSTFLGGTSIDSATKCALDAADNIFVTGFTTSTDFPTQNAAQNSLAGETDAFVTKLNPQASAILYSTYLGSSLDDSLRSWPNGFGPNLILDVGGIAALPNGRVLVTGTTYGSNFPMLDPLKNNNEDYWQDGWATLFESDGAIGFSTYLGGANGDSAYAVARAGDGFVVAGVTSPGWRLPDFPSTPGAAHGFTLSSADGFVVKLDTATPPLSNDAFVNAAFIEGLEATLFVQTSNATRQASEPNHAGNSGGKSVWFRWTAPATGRLILTTLGSDFPTATAVYRGNTISSLQLASSSRSGIDPDIRTPVNGGETLYIAVAGIDNASGNLYLSLLLSLPPNDNFADRAALVGATATVSGSTVGSTSEAGETALRTIWWKWTCPNTGAYTFTTAGSTFPTWLALYTGDSFPTLQFITDNRSYTNNVSRLTTKAQAGVEYQIQISGDGAATGDVTLSVFPTIRPPNDDFANRTRLTNRNELVTGNDFDAVFDPIELGIQNAVNLLYGSGRIVWWEWTSPIEGAVEIATTNSVTQFGGAPVGVKMIVFPGETFPPLSSTVLTSFDPDGRLPAFLYITEVHVGTRYQIGLDSAPWEQPAQFSLKIRAITPPKIIGAQIDVTRTFRANVEGIEGRNYRVVASTNLTDWDPISSHPAIPGEFAFESPVGAGYRYFRIEEVP